MAVDKDTLNNWLDMASSVASTAGDIFTTGYGMYSTIKSGNTEQAAQNFTQTLSNANTTSGNLSVASGMLKWAIPAIVGILALFLFRKK